MARHVGIAGGVGDSSDLVRNRGALDVHSCRSQDTVFPLLSTDRGRDIG